MATPIVVNGYSVNQPGVLPPWGSLEAENFTSLFNMMPTNGTTIVDASSVPSPHKHSKLYYDENTEIVSTSRRGLLIKPTSSSDTRIFNFDESSSGAGDGCDMTYSYSSGSLTISANTSVNIGYGGSAYIGVRSVLTKPCINIGSSFTADRTLHVREASAGVSSAQEGVVIVSENDESKNLFLFTSVGNVGTTAGLSFTFGGAAVSRGHIAYRYAAGTDERIVFCGWGNNIDTPSIYITYDGLHPIAAGAAVATIHCIAQNASPTSTTAGALWLDTDAGGNGHLMCYANGGWRTVAAL